ncbi:MAG: carbohydrate kinase, partial [Methanomassiliicoccales archaeon]
DFTPYKGVGTYIMNFGGAPANVAISSSRMGVKSAFIGKIGNDQFGLYLSRTLSKENVDISGLITTDEACTTLAFVHLNDEGERTFSFVRKPGADMLILPEEVPVALIGGSKIFHFGSAQLSMKNGRAAITKAIQIAHQADVLVSFDPNYRASQWNSEKDAKQWINEFVNLVDIVKVSQEEALWISDKKDLWDASLEIQKRGLDLVIVSCGSSGAHYRIKNCAGFVKGYSRVAVDTTGAGDAFWGTILACISEYDSKKIESIGAPEIEQFLKYGNAAGAICVGYKGAIAHKSSRKLFQQVIDFRFSDGK